MVRGGAFARENKGYRHPGPIQGREASVRDQSRKTHWEIPRRVSPTAMEATAGDYPDRRVRIRFQRILVARGLSC